MCDVCVACHFGASGCVGVVFSSMNFHDLRDRMKVQRACGVKFRTFYHTRILQKCLPKGWLSRHPKRLQLGTTAYNVHVMPALCAISATCTNVVGKVARADNSGSE